MPKQVVPLSDVKIKKMKEGTLRDGDGLYIMVSPVGTKLWRFDYRHAGKRLTLSLGSYPEVSLEAARDLRMKFRSQVANGINPGAVKKIARTVKTDIENSFEVVTREWHAKFKDTWGEKHGFHKLQRLASNVFPWVGNIAIDKLEAPELLATLRRVESRGAVELAHRIRTSCVQVFQYAIATGRATRNIAADLKGAIPPSKGGHHAAITEPTKLGLLLRDIDNYSGSFLVKSALQLLPMLFVRPGELRTMEWLELDGEIWSIPGSKMKMKDPLLVPLCQQALSIIKEVKPLTGGSRFVFQSQRSPTRPLSENTLNAALRGMGYSKSEVVSHGFRATARTLLDEVLGYRVDFIEHQLAHAVKDPNGRAYNRTSFILERTEMMQTWADYLQSLKPA